MGCKGSTHLQLIIVLLGRTNSNHKVYPVLWGETMWL